MSELDDKQTSSFEHDEVYPNSPLVEVVCELRFPGDLEIECRRHLFQQRIRERYPHLLVPQVQPGAHFGMVPYRFENTSRKQGMSLAINRFAYYVREYGGHTGFFDELFRLTDLLRDVFPTINELTRLGWRYVNIIPIVRENGCIALERFFQVNLTLPSPLSGKIADVDYAIVAPVEENQSLTTRIRSLVSAEQPHQEAVLLDFDFAFTQGLNIESLRDCVTQARAYARTAFETLITGSYRQFLRGLNP